MLARRNSLKILISSLIPWLTRLGVNVNTASSTLLSHVSGLNKTISENIVAYREENGEFTSRDEIKKVPRLMVPKPLNKPPVSSVFQTLKISWIIRESTQSLIQR